MERFIKRRLIYIVFDLLLVILSYLIILHIATSSARNYFNRYFYSFMIFLGIWLFVSWFFKKYAFHEYNRFDKIFRSVLVGNFVIAGTIGILMYFSRTAYYSRWVVFGTMLLATFFEFLFGLVYHFLKTSNINGMPPDHEYLALKAQHENGYLGHNGNGSQFKPFKLSQLQEKTILEECNGGTLQFIEKNNLFPSETVRIVSTTNPINIKSYSQNHQSSIINLKRVNDIRFVSQFFSTVNESLPDGGTFICCVETKDLRKQRIFKKYPFILNYIYYYLIDFPIKRVLPKFNSTKWLYFLLTRGQNRVITRAETLGRLIYAGFEVLDEDYIDSMCYIAVKKACAPANDPDPSYGPLVRLKRVGKNGNIITVFKMRTMYPYAEYLQDYIYQRYRLKSGGKFENDFRVSTQGKFMRKFWIDELPMTFNILNGDLKLFGVRPLSQHYFNLYSKDLQEMRTKYKPGLIPPFYADMPKTLEEIQLSEKRYLESYEKAPFRTDWKYFWKAWYNIIFKHARSQ